MPVSLCSQLNHQSNTSAGITASNIAKAGLKTWFVYCTNDNCGINPPLNVPQNWVTGIKAAGGATPRLTMLTKTIPRGLYSCSDTLAHDTWSRAFDPNFKASFVGNGNVSNANDGINKNMYEWFTQQLSATLPVTLKSFTAKFAGNKVQLNWMTTDEKDNASFTIERADADQKFISLDTIGGANNYSGEKAYSYTDASPITGLGFYRLVQTDIDGKKTYLEIRKVLNQSTENQQVVVFPNPFSAEVSAFVSLQASQKVIVLLTDISGKTIRTTNGVYAKGTSEIRIRSSDLPGGIYFLKVQGTDFNFIRKIVKQ